MVWRNSGKAQNPRPMIKDIIHKNESATPCGGTLEKLHRDFPQCFDKNGNFDLQKFQNLISAEVPATHEGYGLDFLGRNYANLIAATDTETIVVPDGAHNSKPENAASENVYITGDNLDALKHLLKSYSNSVKCIYIDPPYNTGNDGFVYSDSFNFTAAQLEQRLGVDEERAERILDLTSRRSSSHSAWLTFMASRLFLARDLLTDDGVIFISIDDNEQANLKLLCDSIFGEENFVAQFTRKGSGGRQDSKHYAIVHEYVLCYSSHVRLFESGKIRKEGKIYPYWDEKKKKHYNLQLLRKWGENSRRTDRPNLYYPIKDPDGKDFYPMLNEKDEGCWRWGKETMQKNIDNGNVEFKKKKGKWVAYEKMFEVSDGEQNTQLFTTVIDDIKNTTGATLLKALIGDKVFSYPKPVDLIKRICCLANTHGDDIILDFFSGSATTAHAVMQLNAEENGEGRRKFIMVQLPEATPQGSPARNAGYATIDQIGMERIRRAAEKIRGENPLFAGKMDLGFKHFTLHSVARKTLDRLEKFDPHAALTDDDILKTFGRETVLATWLVGDGYGLTAKPQELRLAKYTAYTIGRHIYLLEGGDFDNSAMVALIEKYGNDPAFNPTEIVAFGYSFNYGQTEMLRSNLRMLHDGAKHLKAELHIRY